MEGEEKRGRTLMSPLTSEIRILRPMRGAGGSETSEIVGDSWVTQMRESHCEFDKRADARAVEDHVE